MATSRIITRLAGAAALALLLSPLVALAQTPGPADQPTENVCVRACTVEYENQRNACESSNDRQACISQADGAFRTCMAVCPANK